jgi:hypothetical protein
VDIDNLLAHHDPARHRPLPGPDSAEAMGLYQEIIRPSGHRRTGRSPRRRIAIGIASGAAAALAAGLTLASLTGGTLPAGPAPGHPNPPAGGGVIAAHLTAKQVLHKAAAAALSETGVTPRPDQFVFTKVRDGSGKTALTWLSVDGTRNSLIKGGQDDTNGSTTLFGCANGERRERMPGRNGKPLKLPPHRPGTPVLPKKGQRVPMDGPVITVPCTAHPAFFPDMPTSASAMPAYLARQGITPSNINNLGKSIGDIFEFDYVLPAQRAALYEFLATTPGLTVEHNVHDISGRPGIGVGWSAGGGKTLLIFDPGSFTLLGETTWGEQGELGGDALLQMAIVNQAGQLP